MQATLDASTLKSLTKAVTCLTKYGDELVIAADQDTLCFSTTNSSKSAYCRFKYDKQYFTRYRLGNSAGTPAAYGSQTEEGQLVQGQVLTKAFLSVLKHKTVEKSVERCVISIQNGDNPDDDEEERDSLESKLVVRFHCKHGVVKTHRLLLSNPTTLLAPGLLDGVNETRLVIGPKTLRDLLDHFQIARGSKSDPVLIWTLEENEITLRSNEAGLTEARGRTELTTEISLSANEFDVYDPYETPMTVAFQIREFTAAIIYADAMSTPLELRLKDRFFPLVLTVEEDYVQTLFVQAMSSSFQPIHVRASQMQQPTKKRERDPSETETPRMKRPMRAAQTIDPESVQQGRRAPPQPTPMQHSYSEYNQASTSRHQLPPPPARPTKSEPLFLPSSQLSAADEEVLRSTGLGIESMNAEELAELLEGEGEEVDFSQQPRNTQDDFYLDTDDQNKMEFDGPDSFELDGALSATQESQSNDRVCHFLL
ncbi:hypothetical protein CPC08DRAFT_630714 [Agrocybe pediades]|nr:hypothetical protein CPC08DRAFT_630714 [Agrocybe pediades]